MTAADAWGNVYPTSLCSVSAAKQMIVDPSLTSKAPCYCRRVYQFLAIFNCDSGRVGTLVMKPAMVASNDSLTMTSIAFLVLERFVGHLVSRLCRELSTQRDFVCLSPPRTRRIVGSLIVLSPHLPTLRLFWVQYRSGRPKHMLITKKLSMSTIDWSW